MLDLRLSCIALAVFFIQAALSFPNVPFTVQEQWIKDSTGATFTYNGVNWPGAGEVMVPEGLQYKSIQNIVSKIKSSGFNAIRLTFATEMIDQIFDNNGEDISIKTAFINALGEENGTSVFDNVIEMNPSWNEGTTRLQVFDAVAEECATQGIYVHLDNHMSKAEWCCSFTDGNGWFGDTYFNVDNWKRSLTYMATHVRLVHGVLVTSSQS